MRSLRCSLFLFTFGFLAPSVAAGVDDAVSSNWFRHPAISPDGSSLVFVHGGDLFTVPVAGGQAIPLTVQPSYETRPVWSRDGKWIAFASDRAGNFDVFVMPAGGGDAVRLTHHSANDFPSDFTPCGGYIIFESSRMHDVDAALFPSGVLPQLYRVPVSGGTPTMILTTPALNARFDGEGRRLVYEDVKGFEDDLRKHHRSSITRDVWTVDLESGRHFQRSDSDAEDRAPSWSADGRSIWFLSERAGDANVFRMPASGGPAEQLTHFVHHPVRHLSLSANDVAVFSWHGELYRLIAGEEPAHIAIRLAVDNREGTSARVVRNGATEFAVSPGGKEIAFVARGDVFVTSTEFETTRRITNTPEQERSVEFAPDGRTIYYAGEREGSWNIYKAEIVEEDELYFFSATRIRETPIRKTEDDTFQPSLSPDGKKLAWLRNRAVVEVMDLETEEVVVAVPGDVFYSYSDGDFTFEWSPDGHWLAVTFYNRGRAFVGQTGIIRADGSRTWPIDISNSGYDDNSPRWSMEGGVLAWRSDRYGMRTHGSWGAQYDVVAAFLTQDAFDRFRLSREEYELRKELDKKREERAKESTSDQDDGELTEGEEESEEVGEVETSPLEFELEGIEARTIRLTLHASDLGDFALSPEGDRLYYVARFEQGANLWVRDFRKESTSMLVRLDAGSVRMRMAPDGSKLHLLVDGRLIEVDPQSGAQKGVSFAAPLDIHAEAERRFLYDHVWRQTKRKFYRADMHGVDWAFYRDQYEPKLAGLRSNRTFAEVLSELLGELNASHTGSSYIAPRHEGSAQTASLGVFYDQSWVGPGRRIAEVMTGGPLDRAELPVRAGMILEAIDDQPLDEGINFYALLDRKAGQRVRLTFRPDPDGEGEDVPDSIDVVVRPITLAQENELRYRRWVRQRRAIVEEASGGRLGYMHVRGMNDPSFREFYGKVLGKYYDREGLIVDTRFNGGGWLHDDLITFLTGSHYVEMYPRNDEAPGLRYDGDSMWRWTKPSAVVMSESNYSDAHFFPWAYMELGIGPTIGMPVPGTATAVWWERLHTGDLVFGIPQVGMKGRRGIYLENKQLEPTHRVPLDPESAASGFDTQVLEAVRVLLEGIADRSR